MLYFNKTPILVVCFFQIVSLSLANTKSPPPGDYVDSLPKGGCVYRTTSTGESWNYLELKGGERGFEAWSDDRWGPWWEDDYSDHAYIKHLHVSATTVVSFHGDGNNINYFGFHVEKVSFSGDSMLVFDLNSQPGDIKFKASTMSSEVMSHMALKINGQMRKAYWNYQHGYYHLDKSRINDPWTPLPEASTYGAAFSFSALAAGFIRKRKRRREHLLTPSGVPV